MSFGELCVLVIVAIVVIGPKDLPRFLRKAGQMAGKLRRMATDVRAQSGIDEVLRSEGLTGDIAEIRRLAKGDFIDPIRGALSATPAVRASPSENVSAYAPTVAYSPGMGTGDFVVVREREYPTEGADSYAAIPDTAIVYARGLPVSPHASDPLYVVGDADAPLPPPEPEPEPDADPEHEEPAPEPTAEAPLVAVSPDLASDAPSNESHPDKVGEAETNRTAASLPGVGSA
jgi:sec-independent protein translocase protein TatB